MRQATLIAGLAGCRLFAVNPARPDLAGYYARFGFATIDATPTLMVMTLQKVRSTLDASDAEESAHNPPA